MQASVSDPYFVPALLIGLALVFMLWLYVGMKKY